MTIKKHILKQKSKKKALGGAQCYNGKKQRKTEKKTTAFLNQAISRKKAQEKDE
jgi:hypothetical protein